MVTWQDERSDFGPGMLDLVAYDHRTLEPRNGFVLDTETLDGSTRATLGVRARDSRATDHLLLVVDFGVRPRS